MLDIQSKESRDIGLARTQLEVLDRDLAYLERDFRAKETAYFAAKERSVGHPTTTIQHQWTGFPPPTSTSPPLEQNAPSALSSLPPPPPLPPITVPGTRSERTRSD